MIFSGTILFKPFGKNIFLIIYALHFFIKKFHKLILNIFFTRNKI
jgi:hypothetical protein